MQEMMETGHTEILRAQETYPKNSSAGPELPGLFFLQPLPFVNEEFG